jgi:hypothetical protein
LVYVTQIILTRYSPELSKTDSARKELEEWHNSVKDKPFIFNKESVKYGMQVLMVPNLHNFSAANFALQDTLILMLCSEELNKITMEFTDGDISLLNSSTFTLACECKADHSVLIIACTLGKFYPNIFDVVQLKIF